MPKFKTKLTSEATILVSVCIGAAMLGFALGITEPARATSSAPLSSYQSDEKSISIVVRDDELVEFGDLGVRRSKVTPNRKFSLKSLGIEPGKQGDDWIESLEFSIKNKSDKQITSIVFELQFPDTEFNGPLMGFRGLSLGLPPNVPQNPHNQVQPLILQRDAKSTFQLSTSELQRIKDFLALRKFHISDLNTLVIKVLYLTFDDDTKWSSGHFYRANPSAPGGYERIPQ